MQQQQQPDLMLALQQMMQRKQMADVEQGQRQQELDMRHSQITADRMEHGADQYRAGIQQGIENRRADAKLKLLESGNKSLDEYRKAQATRAAAATAAQNAKADAQKRMALSMMYTARMNSPESYEELPTEVFNESYKDPVSRSEWTMGKVDKDSGEPLSYRRLRPEIKKELEATWKGLEKIGGIMAPEDFLTQFGQPDNTGSEEEMDGEAFFQQLWEQASD
jgi:hypothetical protein